MSVIEKDLTKISQPLSWQEAQQAAEEDLDFEEDEKEQDGRGPNDEPAEPIKRSSQWARKEPLKSKKRLLYEEDEDAGSEDIDYPDILDYLSDYDLSPQDKIALLRSAANYESAKLRKSKSLKKE